MRSAEAMRGRLIALAIVAALPLLGLAGSSSAAAPARDWSHMVVTTPEGGLRMGNPAAALKLVEYGSLTCPHCAHFSEQAMPGLLAEVRTGRVSYEFRNFIRDPADLTAALLSRCVPPARYFDVTGRIFAAQLEWIGRLQALSEADMAAINALPAEQRPARFAAASGLPALTGLTPAQVGACLADQKATDKLLEIRRSAIEQDKLEATPTFLLNGAKLDNVYDWATLQPHLAAAK